MRHCIGSASKRRLATITLGCAALAAVAGPSSDAIAAEAGQGQPCQTGGYGPASIAIQNIGDQAGYNRGLPTVTVTNIAGNQVSCSFSSQSLGNSNSVSVTGTMSPSTNGNAPRPNSTTTNGQMTQTITVTQTNTNSPQISVISGTVNYTGAP